MGHLKKNPGESKRTDPKYHFWSYNLIKLLNFMKGVLNEVLRSLSLRNSKLDHLNRYFWLL